MRCSRASSMARLTRSPPITRRITTTRSRWNTTAPPSALSDSRRRCRGHARRRPAAVCQPRHEAFAMTATLMTRRQEEIRDKALKDLQQFQVLMLDGHFDFGNGYHGRLYLNPHRLFRYPSTIWRFAQELIDVLPGSVLDSTEVVAGPATGGALLAHTVAGLLDSRREIGRTPMMFAPFVVDAYRGPGLSRF